MMVTVRRPAAAPRVEPRGPDAVGYGTRKGDLAAQADVHSGAGDNQVIVRVDPRNVPAKGGRSYVAIRPGQARVFGAASGQRIS